MRFASNIVNNIDEIDTGCLADLRDNRAENVKTFIERNLILVRRIYNNSTKICWAIMKLVESSGMSHYTSTAHKHVVKNFRTRNEISKVLEISVSKSRNFFIQNFL